MENARIVLQHVAIHADPAINFDKIHAEDFSHTDKTHDWRNHVPRYLQKQWKMLDDNSRLALYIMAERQAQDEEWD